MKGKVARRLFHVLAGSIPPLLGFVLPREWLLLFLGGLAAIFVTIESLRILLPSLNASLMGFFSRASTAFKEREATRPIGSTYFLVAAFLVFLFFPRDVAIAALFYAAVGDPAAASVGERFGRRRLGEKSLEGTGAFFASVLIVGLILLLAGMRLNWLAVALGAAAGALAELVPVRLDDNLTIPIVVAVVMALAL
ncbi:MAG: hypothetical protein M1358_15530 [Chloroflexi bacterium]|nr:hypothetical protein [Chloroflexota bacterium]